MKIDICILRTPQEARNLVKWFIDTYPNGKTHARGSVPTRFEHGDTTTLFFIGKDDEILSRELKGMNVDRIIFYTSTDAYSEYLITEANSRVLPRRGEVIFA